VCPEVEPVQGEACKNPDLVCGYGTSIMPSCRSYYRCQGEAWISDPRNDQYPCDEPASDDCPAMPPPAYTACAPVAGRAPCVYAEVSCSCIYGEHWAASKGDEWLCFGPPSDPLYPKALPNVGEGCSSPGVQCSYLEDCDFPPYSTVVCRQGSWEEGERSTPCRG
jgi:hypothetical protein